MCDQVSRWQHHYIFLCTWVWGFQSYGFTATTLPLHRALEWLHTGRVETKMNLLYISSFVNFNWWCYLQSFVASGKDFVILLQMWDLSSALEMSAQDAASSESSASTSCCHWWQPSQSPVSLTAFLSNIAATGNTGGPTATELVHILSQCELSNSRCTTPSVSPSPSLLCGTVNSTAQEQSPQGSVRAASSAGQKTAATTARLLHKHVRHGAIEQLPQKLNHCVTGCDGPSTRVPPVAASWDVTTVGHESYHGEVGSEAASATRVESNETEEAERDDDETKQQSPASLTSDINKPTNLWTTSLERLLSWFSETFIDRDSSTVCETPQRFKYSMWNSSVPGDSEMKEVSDVHYWHIMLTQIKISQRYAAHLEMEDLQTPIGMLHTVQEALPSKYTDSH